jgi:hypothetical protein
MISCVDSPQICAHEATELCPAAMDIVSNTTNPGDFGRMTMIIKCKPNPTAAPAPPTS